MADRRLYTKKNSSLGKLPKPLLSRPFQTAGTRYRRLAIADIGPCRPPTSLRRLISCSRAMPISFSEVRKVSRPYTARTRDRTHVTRFRYHVPKSSDPDQRGPSRYPLSNYRSIPHTARGPCQYTPKPCLPEDAGNFSVSASTPTTWTQGFSRLAQPAAPLRRPQQSRLYSRRPWLPQLQESTPYPSEARGAAQN